MDQTFNINFWHGVYNSEFESVTSMFLYGEIVTPENPKQSKYIVVRCSLFNLMRILHSEGYNVWIKPDATTVFITKHNSFSQR